MKINANSNRYSSNSSRGSRRENVLRFVNSNDGWREQAACKDISPDVFFPDGKGKHAEEAKEICAGCCVQQACLDEAVARNEHYGVFGGLTYRERLRYRREQMAAAV